MTRTPTRPASRPSPDSAGGILAFGLGSNLGNSRARLRWAVAELERLYGPLAVAPLYVTAPVSPIPQPDFFNSVALASLPAPDRLGPAEVLEEVKALERRAGRREGVRLGPRALDVDLLLFGDLERGGADLTLPHPAMRRRRFVLAPLADLAPDLALPPDGAVVRDLLAALGGGQRVERVPWDA